MDDFPVRVRDFDADGGFARDRREDPDVGGGDRVGDVPLQVGDLLHLDPRPQFDFVLGDGGAAQEADHPGVHPELAEGGLEGVHDPFVFRGLGGVRLASLEEVEVRELIVAVPVSSPTIVGDDELVAG